MAVDPTPYLVGGGAEHSPEIVRQALYDSTGGAEGVSAPGALKVTAQSTANGTVRVAPGGGLMQNRYAGGSGQSYDGRNISSTDVTVPATSSGGSRTDLIVMRVLDPQYEGQPPADPTTFQYTRLAVIQGVSSSIRRASELNLGYPAIALARITRPASTGTVTNAHITDLRKLARPRRENQKRLLFPTVNKTMSKTGYTAWPFSGVMSQIEIPEWATNLSIVATVNGIEIIGAGVNAGGVRTGFAGNYAQNGVVKSGGTGGRQSIAIIGNHTITQAMRDAGVGDLELQGYQTLGSGTIEADYQSGIAVEWEFTEVPS